MRRLTPIPAKSSGSPGNYFWSDLPPKRSFCLDLDDADLGYLRVPVLGNGLEDEAKVPLVAWLQRVRTNRLSIDIGFARADKGERQSVDLRRHGFVVAKDYLHGNPGDTLVASVLDVSVDKSRLSTGEAGRFAHGKLGYRKIASIGCQWLDRGWRGCLVPS